ncbi:YdcF family protein [Candidatus Woesearchaeota archaeon]|nr:YdcF family protein [Candidatus Woesearchaeota archaeon]
MQTEKEDSTKMNLFSFSFNFIPSKRKLVSKNIDAIFVPALCTSWNGKRLSKLCEQSVIVASKFAKKHKTKLILSNSNLNLGKLEKKYKQSVLRKINFKQAAIYIMPEEKVTNTYDEIERLCELNKKKNFRTILVVGEKWHMPRIMFALKKKMHDVEFFALFFEAKNYEPINTKPSLKGLFAASKPSWIVYNAVSYFLAPFLVKK